MTNKPKKVILHCSASPDKDIPLVNASIIDGWHKKRGWDGIGYHFVITRAGIIENGRNPGKYGAHTYGHNENSLGVCWVGTQYPEDVQLRELLNLYVLIYKTWKIDYNNWYGHHEFNKRKTCPGFSMLVFRKLLEYHHKLTLV